MLNTLLFIVSVTGIAILLSGVVVRSFGSKPRRRAAGTLLFATGSLYAGAILWQHFGQAKNVSRSMLLSSRASLRACPVFPPDNVWNTRIDDLPRHPRSDDYVESIGLR